MKSETIAKLLVAYSGLAWGLFWLPLHRLEQAGMSPLWAVVVFNLVPTFLVLPIALFRWSSLRQSPAVMSAAGIAMGLTQVFYALSVLNTEVVRAITIFYLNPVWTALLARLVFGEKLGATGIAAMLLAFAGMGLVLHTGFNIPWPEKSGDWYAILAGLAWSSSVILLRLQPEGHPVDLTVHALAWTGLLLVPVVIIAANDGAPSLALVGGELWWLVPFVLLVLMTGVFASMWAVPKLPPNLVSLLYMTEISAAAISAALFSGQEFTLADAAGVTLLALAGALGSIVQLIARAASAPQNSRTG